jgi:hypothetical protein
LTASFGSHRDLDAHLRSDSHVEWFEGNFAAYEEDKKRRLGIDSMTS